MKNICNGWDKNEFPYINFSPDESVSEETRIWQGCPTVAVTRGGRIFAGWNSGGELEPCILNYNIFAVSDDDGKTWSDPLLTIGTDFENRMRRIDIQYWITKENHLWVTWVNSPFYETSKPASLKAILTAKIKPDYHKEFLSTMVMVCKDPDADDLVWEKPRYLCDGFLRNKIIETASGRIIAPAYDYEGDTYTLRISDDGGKTFFTSEAQGKPDRNVFDEICIYEMSPGVLRFLARTDEKGYMHSHSYDNGDTWEVATRFEDAPSTRIYIGKLKSGRVIYVRNISDTERNGMKISLSEDGGVTYPWVLVLDERISLSYPDVTEDKDGNIYIVHDRERHNGAGLDRETWTSTAAKEILICKVTEEDIMKGKLSPTSYVGRVISKAKINKLGDFVPENA